MLGFLELTDLYLQFCDESREPAYITAITKESCGWPDRKTFPNGQWHKRPWHDHVILTSFLGKLVLQKTMLRMISFLSMCAEAVVVLNPLFSRNVRQWPVAWSFLLAIASVALECNFCVCIKRLGVGSFFLSPKALFRLPSQVPHRAPYNDGSCQDSCLPAWNPLTFGVQIDEDFIGKKSRVGAPRGRLLR